MNRRTVLSLLALTGLGCFSADLQATPAAIGVVAELKGMALGELNDIRRRLEFEADVFLGETLRTGENSRLGVLLAEKTRLRLGAETIVTVDRFIVDAGGELTLGSGAVLVDTPSGALPQGLTVQSPFALIAVRGTRFFAGPIEGVFGVFVERGAVNVSAGGETVRLDAGEGTDIPRAGGPPGPVKKWGKAKIDKARALVQ